MMHRPFYYPDDTIPVHNQSNAEAKKQLSAEIARDVDAYLRAGGKIVEIPPGAVTFTMPWNEGL